MDIDKNIIKKNELTLSASGRLTCPWGTRLTGQKIKIYKKRMIIESFNSWFKNFAVLDQNYQKTIKSYYGLFLCAASIMTFFRI